MVAARKDAAAFGRLNHDFGAVDVASNHVTALVDQAVRRIGLFHRQRPVAGKDDRAGNRRDDAPSAQREGIDIAEDLRDWLAGNEAELFRFGCVTGDNAAEVFAFVDVAEVSADVFWMPIFVVEPAAVKKCDVGMFLRSTSAARVDRSSRRTSRR